MESKISDLIIDAMSKEDYEFRINFLVAGLLSEESNDTKEKELQNMVRLKEIAEFAKENGCDGEKGAFLQRTADRIEGYLKNTETE